MNKYQENIISAVNQNKQNVYVHGTTGLKVMFAGNSITKHAPKPEVGWTNDCGMAASSLENDYVHQLIKMMREELGEVSYTIVQVANFERNFSTDIIDSLYSQVKDYNPDILIMFFGANVSKEYDVSSDRNNRFAVAYEALRNYLSGPNTKVYHSQGFYIRPVLDAEKEFVAKKYGDAFINIEDIRNSDEAHGKFNHPSDWGMKKLAERFWSVIKK